MYYIFLYFHNSLVNPYNCNTFQIEYVLFLGCLNVGSSRICSKTDCIEKTDGTEGRNFCCCYKDLCNQNYTGALTKGNQVTGRKKLVKWSNTGRDASYGKGITGEHCFPFFFFTYTILS